MFSRISVAGRCEMLCDTLSGPRCDPRTTVPFHSPIMSWPVATAGPPLAPAREARGGARRSKKGRRAGRAGVPGCGRGAAVRRRARLLERPPRRSDGGSDPIRDRVEPLTDLASIRAAQAGLKRRVVEANDANRLRRRSRLARRERGGGEGGRRGLAPKPVMEDDDDASLGPHGSVVLGARGRDVGRGADVDRILATGREARGQAFREVSADREIVLRRRDGDFDPLRSRGTHAVTLLSFLERKGAVRRWQAPVHWTCRRASARVIACESYHEDTYISTRNVVSPDAVGGCAALWLLCRGLGVGGPSAGRAPATRRAAAG